MRVSAAYKGVNALLMHEGAKDFRSGQAFSQTIFFDENVDIHHIFPQEWCKKQGIDRNVYDSIINKTPLAARTNRIIGGVAPSVYVSRIERENTELAPAALAERLRSHLLALPDAVLGGRVWARLSPFLRPAVSDALVRTGGVTTVRPLTLRESRLGTDVAAVGAACLVLDGAFTARPSHLLITD